MPTKGQASLIDILRWRSTNQPDRLAYRFLPDGEFEEVIMTYSELDHRARAIGALLQLSAMEGDRALLLYPPGLDFIAAYLGCLYAKIIAIPSYPPHAVRLEKSLPITLRIIADAKPAVALLTTSLFNGINSQNETRVAFSGIKLLVTDTDEIDIRADKWQQPEIKKNDTAFLQYTSGSTTSPKGVIINHGNLIHNLGLIEKSLRLSSESHTIIWLPPYHDMGLIGGLLQPLYTGNPVTLIPHLMFLQKPFRWLQAITRFSATTSGGPNFAYDLCVRKIKPEQRAQLDLSTWEVAFNGAESINPETLVRFADYFAPCGFRREAFLPCYGLAEATLIVVGGPKNKLPVTINLEKLGLAENKVLISPVQNEDTLTVVSSGQNLGKQNIRIVDAETLALCLPDQIGEIWVSGPSIASGYWNRPEESLSTFGAQINNRVNEGGFLRTGDLGFLKDGELYITGRLKNLIIIDGKNHHPHDIERTVEKSHQAIVPAGCAVFSIAISGAEKVVVLAEIQHKLLADTAEIINAIRSAVTANHDLKVYDIKLTLPGTLPKTTSGKIKHFLCKKNYLSATLKETALK